MIPGCQLNGSALPPQIGRYRQLAAHVKRIKRELGDVRVEFDEHVPDGLLEYTLAVERECCTFVGIEYKPESRTLTFTVERVAQDPRLDSLTVLLTPIAMTNHVT